MDMSLIGMWHQMHFFARSIVVVMAIMSRPQFIEQLWIDGQFLIHIESMHI